jgi:hypothetical protein
LWVVGDGYAVIGSGQYKRANVAYYHLFAFNRSHISK